MNTQERTSVTVQATIQAPVQIVWKNWTSPQAIVQWNYASEDWHTPHAENDLRVGGTFRSRMEAKDGSFGFDFEGIYDAVRENEYIEYHLADGRKIKVSFFAEGASTRVTETFDTETENPVEMQRQGWQAILDNFRKFTEANP
jgi:uncharacterized protein YndB with AHSA1/START domain